MKIKQESGTEVGTYTLGSQIQFSTVPHALLLDSLSFIVGKT